MLSKTLESVNYITSYAYIYFWLFEDIKSQGETIEMPIILNFKWSLWNTDNNVTFFTEVSLEKEISFWLESVHR